MTYVALFVLGWSLGWLSHIAYRWYAHRSSVPRCQAILSTGMRCEFDRAHEGPHCVYYASLRGVGGQEFYWTAPEGQVVDVDWVPRGRAR